MSQNFKQNEVNYLRAEFVFSDESSNFVSPGEPEIGEKVTVIIRTAKDNADKVFFHLELAPAVEMEKFKDKGCFSYYHAETDSIVVTLSY